MSVETAVNREQVGLEVAPEGAAVLMVCVLVQEESGDRLTEEESAKLSLKVTAMEETTPSATAAKFGWIQGVLVCCVFSYVTYRHVRSGVGEGAEFAGPKKNNGPIHYTMHYTIR